jgi:hypothetical protein
MKCPNCGSELVDLCDCCERWRCFGCDKHLTEEQVQRLMKEKPIHA